MFKSMDLLCTLKNIHLSYGSKVIFDNTGISISKGDRIGLLGLNGSGKSSLLNILTEEVTPDKHVPPFIFDKTKSAEERIGFSIFKVPQEIKLKNKEVTIENFIYNFYPEIDKLNNELSEVNSKLDENNLTVIDRQKELLEMIEHLDGYNLISSYQSYLKYFGIDDFTIQVASLSGGEQKKILLSLGFSSSANLILWDEPTNHLDLETIKLFETELNNSINAFILISHDRYLLAKMSRKIFHIKDGMIERFNGGYTDYLKFLVKNESSKIKLLDKLNNTLRREDDWMRQGIKARGCRSKKRVEGVYDLKDKIAKIKSTTKDKLVLEISSSNRKSKKIIGIKDISFSYGDKVIFNNINFQIFKGDKIGIMGRNGIGKTTLANIIAGRISGTGSYSSAEKLTIQFFSQKRLELSDDITPYELLGDGQDFIHVQDRSIHVMSYFKSFLFNQDEINRPLKTFSGGEKSRLQLAINLTKSADLWIFDEPTNDLDLETIEILESKLKEFPGTILLISHDRAFLSSVTNKILLIENEGVTSFQAGFSQAEAYLDACSYDNILGDNNISKTSVKLEGEAPVIDNKKIVVKLTNREKMRVKELPDEIFKLEKILEKYSAKLQDFDFTSINSSDLGNYNSLSCDINFKEEQLLSLYEELESLKSKK